MANEIREVCNILHLNIYDWWLLSPDFEKAKMIGYRRTLYGKTPPEEVGNIYEVKRCKDGIESFKIAPLDIPLEFIRAFDNVVE